MARAINLMFSRLLGFYFELFESLNPTSNWSVNVKWQSYDYPYPDPTL